MTAYVALLRGINVGGYAKISMARLREVFVLAGYPQARTYIQSGNVVFESGQEPRHIIANLETAIHDECRVAARVLLRSRAQLDALVSANPFAERQIDPARLGVVFLSLEAPAISLPQGWTEEVVPAGEQLYVHYPNGMGRSKLGDAFFAKHVSGVFTVRNWRTVNKIRALMDS